MKLTYFDIRGRAETARLVLAFAGASYEDDRLPFPPNEVWAAKKPGVTLGQLPILEVGGKTLHQSMAIARYLAKENGLAGANNLESAQCDEIVDFISDMQNAIYTSHYTKDPAGRDAALKEVFEKTVPEGLLKLETYLNGNNGKFFVGNAFTWTELHFQQFMDLVHGMTGNNQILDATPNLKDLNTRICAVPSVAKWIETRPKNPF
jgi:glutathione S-transferase